MVLLFILLQTFTRQQSLVLWKLISFADNNFIVAQMVHIVLLVSVCLYMQNLT